MASAGMYDTYSVSYGQQLRWASETSGDFFGFAVFRGVASQQVVKSWDHLIPSLNACSAAFDSIV